MVLEILGGAGITQILVRGSVLAWLRRIRGAGALLKCAMCAGWWVGILLGLVRVRELESGAHQVLEQIVAVVVEGGAVSALATALDFTLAWIDSHTKVDP